MPHSFLLLRRKWSIAQKLKIHVYIQFYLFCANHQCYRGPVNKCMECNDYCCGKSRICCSLHFGTEDLDRVGKIKEGNKPAIVFSLTLEERASKMLSFWLWSHRGKAIWAGNWFFNWDWHRMPNSDSWAKSCLQSSLLTWENDGWLVAAWLISSSAQRSSIAASPERFTVLLVPKEAGSRLGWAAGFLGWLAAIKIWNYVVLASLQVLVQVVGPVRTSPITAFMQSGAKLNQKCYQGINI